MRKISKLLTVALCFIIMTSMLLTSCGLLGGLLGGDKTEESATESTADSDIASGEKETKPSVESEKETTSSDDESEEEPSDESEEFSDEDLPESEDIEETEEETEETIAELDVVDLKGREFKMLWPEYISQEGHFRYSELGIADGAEVSRGDVIETVIYKRNRSVEMAYNATVVVTTMRYRDVTETVRGEYPSGMTSYDVIASMNSKMSTLAIEGMLADFNDLEYYDEDQQWWNHDLMQALSIVNKRYFGLGDIIYSDDLYPYVVYVNTSLAETVGIEEDFYDMVNEKEWTLEKFNQLAKLAVADNDNDGMAASSMDDIFGAVDGASFARALYYSAGRGVISFDDMGYPVWQMTEEYGHSVLSKISDMWHSGNAVVDVAQFNNGKTVDAMKIIDMFNSNQMLFMPGDLKAAQAFTSLDNALDDFALLPIPLWESDSEYICIMNEATVISIPVVAQDQDEICLILSALGRESMDTLTPAFFDMVLTDRYMKNAASVKTLKLILSSIVPRDIADIQGWGGFMSQFCKLVIENNTNFSSYYQENITIARTEMDNYITELEKLDK